MTRSLLRMILIGLGGVGCALGVARAQSVRYLSEASAPFDRRMVAEIESVGLRVEQPAIEREPLPADAVALIRVLREPPVIELWLVRGQTVELAATLERDPSVTEERDTIRIAEAMRGFLVPLAERAAAATGTLPAPPPTVADQPSPPPSVPPPPPAAPPVAPPSRVYQERDLGFGLALALSTLPGGLSGSVLVNGRQRVVSAAWVELGAAAPLTPSTLERGPASADVEARLLLAGAHWNFHELLGVSLRAGAGAMLGAVRARGRAPLPRPTKLDSTRTLLPYLSAGLELPFAPALAADLGGFVGYAPERVDVAFGSEVVGTFSRPLVVGHAGLVLRP